MFLTGILQVLFLIGSLFLDSNRTIAEFTVLNSSSFSTSFQGDCEDGLAVTISADNADIAAECLVQLPNGNLLVGGSHNFASLFIEISEEGEVERAFALDVLPTGEYISSLKIDSEGNILCIGAELATSFVRTSFFIKLDPVTLEVIWSTIVQEQDHNFWDIADPGAGMPYITVGRENQPPSPGLGNDAMMRTIDRSNGNFTGDVEKNFSLGSAESFDAVQIHNGNVYFCGRYHTTSAFEDMRIAVSRFDLDGNEAWSRLVIHSASETARMYGRDLVVDEDGICFVGIGDPDGIDVVFVTTFIGKMDFDGNLIWAREINMPGIQAQRGANIEKTSNGYFIWGTENVDNGKRLFIHLNLDGEVLSSGVLDDGLDKPNFVYKDNVVIDGDHFFSVHSGNNPAGTVVFIHHPLENPNGNCDQFETIDVTTELVQSPANVQHTLFAYDRSTPFAPAPVAPEEVELTTYEACSCDSEVDCENEGSYTLSSPGVDLVSNAIIQLPNGNVLIAGAAGNESLIVEMDKGSVVRSATFDALSGSERINWIELDSEGKVILIGHSGDLVTAGYLAKLDPITFQLDWLKVNTPEDHVFTDVMDPGPGQPYVFVGFEASALPPGVGQDAAIRTVDRTTGNFTSGIAKNFTLESAEHIRAAKLHNGSMYFAGRYHTGTALQDMRIAVSRFDLSGNETWTRLLIHPVALNARMYGHELTVTDDGIFFLGNGDPNGASLTNSTAYLGKLGFNGDLQWAKSYDFGNGPGKQMLNIEPTDDGFVLWCRDNFNNTNGFIHIDTDGKIIQSAQFSDRVEFFPGDITTDNLVVHDPSFTAVFTERNGLGNAEIHVVTHPLSESSGCVDLGSYDPSVEDYPSPVSLPYSVTLYDRSTSSNDGSTQVSNFIVTDSVVCGCDEICDNGIDDDMDGLVDCDDPDLQDSCCCMQITPPVISADPEICEGDSTILSITGDYDLVSWNTGDTGLQIVVDQGGLFVVTVSDTCGNSATATFEVFAYPVTYGFIDTVLVDNNPIVINAESYTQPGEFEQILTNANGCDSILLIIIANGTPEICDNGIDDDMDGLIDCADPELFDSCCCLEILPMDLGPDQTITEGDTAFVFINDGYEGSDWSTGDIGLFISVTEEGWYWAESIICDSTIRDSVYVTVVPVVDSCAFDVHVPNVFSPNGDGINDEIRISFPQGAYQFAMFRVFDRWGGIMLETTDPQFSWDGKVGDRYLNPGVYVYTLEYICQGEMDAITGDITIIR